uniref:Uncharacterized protein n=1 Tax=Haptolina brevifila TaxID=156173 RepID=A0A7S2GIQ5_9EUKA|mmetsp:Transcript_38151/g.76459  ORF Transcript_38151/g.76459 Transcript_38151/m.76459 type:complete len:137 (+) Transcript_38151:48-458(+)|eukprot:CAMPEP_0174729114 /NCGR_PEP_ID=MMETSP1094-20130205/53052_1 /TAXON_ID=156173 /ORGANISM="Chrysochromulina brevifilum, Strain UTEX LB 985" /LENGTH=136 /DNA_ID=CAMNT_0015931159 /DNA_START=47 /DNA_END=457 /DNA_ORIENTATION=-
MWPVVVIGFGCAFLTTFGASFFGSMYIHGKSLSPLYRAVELLGLPSWSGPVLLLIGLAVALSLIMKAQRTDAAAGALFLVIPVAGWGAGAFLGDLGLGPLVLKFIAFCLILPCLWLCVFAVSIMYSMYVHQEDKHK